MLLLFCTVKRYRDPSMIFQHLDFLQINKRGGNNQDRMYKKKIIIHFHEMILLIMDDFSKPNQKVRMFLNTVTSQLDFIQDAEEL